MSDNPELEEYRKAAIAAVKKAGPFIRDTARDVLNVPCRAAYVVGSVLEKSQFTEDSDVDVAVVVDGPKADTGLSEALSEKLQQEMLRFPLDDVGIVNTLVFVNQLRLARGRSLKIAAEQ